MPISSDLSTTFYFLAALYESSKDVYNSVYLPIIGHAFASYANQGHTMGTLEDLQDTIHKDFGLVVPVLLVKKLSSSFVKSLSRREQGNCGLTLNNDNSFSFRAGAFSKRILSFEDKRRDTNALQKGFEAYYNAKGESTTVSFSDFLNEYKNRLSSFFGVPSDNIQIPDESKYSLHIEYLQYIEETNSTLYHIAEEAYLGTIIAAYLESGQSEFNIKLNSTVYFFDTRLVLALLDLQEEHETLPVRDLVFLIHSQKGRIVVADETINEVRLNIQKAIDRFSSSSPNSTINEACLRQKISKLDLRTIVNEIELRLRKDYNIEVSPVPKDVWEKASTSSRLEKLQSMRLNKKNALHDIAVSDVVALRRGSKQFSYAKASYWFVTSNEALCYFNNSEHIDKSVPEIVSIEELTSILFFQCPQRDIKSLSSAGLRQIIAQTISYDKPSQDLLSEFDAQLRKNLDITREQYEDICVEVARYSAKKVDDLITQSVEDQDKFKISINAIIQNAKDKEYERKELENKTKDALNSRLKELSNSLKDSQAENRRLKFLLFVIFFVIVGIVLWKYWNQISSLLKIVVSIIVSLGGLWTFLSLIIPIIKKLCK